MSLSTLGGEQDSSWQGCSDSQLKLKNSKVPHGGDAELLIAAWGNNKNIWHKSLREQELHTRAQLSTCVWGLFIRSEIVVPVVPVVSEAVLFVSQ